MILLGIFFAMISAILWPILPMIVEEKIIGTGFGLMTAIQNAGMVLFPFIAENVDVVSES